MCVLPFRCALSVLICWVSVSNSTLVALFFPQVAEDAPANAVLSLLSFWGKPPASVDQMERELQSHSDADKILPAWAKECFHACVCAAQTGHHGGV